MRGPAAHLPDRAAAGARRCPNTCGWPARAARWGGSAPPNRTERAMSSRSVFGTPPQSSNGSIGWRKHNGNRQRLRHRGADHRRRSAQQIGGDMITADPDTFLGYLCRKVDEMKPGQRIDVSIHDLRREIPSFDYGGAMFSAPDRVLENIVGSSYTHSYTVNHERSTVTFERHENTGARHYLSPDRRPADRRRP